MTLFGCFAVVKIRLALSMPTVSSVGEMEDQQRLAQIADVGRKILFGNVIEQPAADAKRPAGERHLDFALLPNLSHLIAEQACDMRRVEGRRNRHHRACLGNAMRGRQHRGTAEAMPDEDRWRGQRAPQMIGGGDEIIHVRGKRGVGELAFARAEAGEIEPQRRDAPLFQSVGDVAGRPVVLAAGKAVREQGDRTYLTARAIKQGGQRLALGIAKIETFGGHEYLLRGERVAIAFRCDRSG
jgi:hypothetical protein